jgi:hypothetical protein
MSRTTEGETMNAFTRRLLLSSIGAVAGLVLSLGASVPALAFNPQPDPPGRASLVGRVTSFCTGRPIGGAAVTLTPVSGESNPPDPDRTNNGGHYLFKGLQSGDYFLGAAADGYLPVGGATTTADVSRPVVHIGTLPAVQRLDFRMYPPDPC